MRILYRYNSTPTTINYGFLYNGYAYNDPRDITSGSGWTITTITNWRDLIDIADPIATDYATGNVAGTILKKVGDVFWTTNNGTDNYNLGLVGGGFRVGSGADFFSIKNTGYYVTADVSGSYSFAEALDNNVYINTTAFIARYAGSAARLIRDASVAELLLADGTYVSKYVGNDSKTYKAVKMGTKVWLAENLAETKYNNGDWITGFDGGIYTPISGITWKALTTEAMCAYDDDLNNV